MKWLRHIGTLVLNKLRYRNRIRYFQSNSYNVISLYIYVEFRYIDTYKFKYSKILKMLFECIYN